MNYNKKTVKDIDVSGKKVLLRCDFNVPMAKDGSGVITDDKRIRAALPTIQYLLEQNAAVIACSHMGKPKGEWKPELSLKIVAARLSELLGKEVRRHAGADHAVLLHVDAGGDEPDHQADHRNAEEARIGDDHEGDHRSDQPAAPDERHDEGFAGHERLLRAMPPPMVGFPHFARKRDWKRP